MRFFDLHCDTASVCYEKGIKPDDLSLSASTKKGEILDEWYQCYAVFINDNSDNPRKDYIEITNDFGRRFQGINKPVPIFTLENSSPVTDLEFVDRLYNDNIRSATLTWNGENALAGGAYTDIGLKPFGRQVIEKFNKYHIACDLSHLNRKSFFEAGEVANIVLASHTCCDKTHKHIRNLTDDQIKYIVSKGGVIGLCFYPEFLGTKYVFEGVWRHINHLLNLGFEDSICIGSDFDGAVMANELDGVDKIPDLYNFLSGRGLTEILLDKIFFKNALNFYQSFDKSVFL